MAETKRAFRPVHAIQMFINILFGSRIYVLAILGTHRISIFIFGIAKLGVRDSFVDGSNCHVYTYADTACSSARHLTVKVALGFRCHFDIIRCLDRAAIHMGADAAVDIVQRDGDSNAPNTAGAYAARSMSRQFVRSFHSDIRSFKMTVGHHGRGLAGGVMDAYIGRQSCANSYS